MKWTPLPSGSISSARGNRTLRFSGSPALLGLSCTLKVSGRCHHLEGAFRLFRLAELCEYGIVHRQGIYPSQTYRGSNCVVAPEAPAPAWLLTSVASSGEVHSLQNTSRTIMVPVPGRTWVTTGDVRDGPRMQEMQ